MANQANLEQLKQKYQSALNLAPQLGIRLEHVHIQDGKLFVQGEAPSEAAKNQLWDQIKLLDPSYSDLTADIRVSAQAAPRTQTAGASAEGHSQRTYRVQPGDTLSKIAQNFYGKANQYQKI